MTDEGISMDEGPEGGEGGDWGLFLTRAFSTSSREFYLYFILKI